ncbi:MAG TPA: glycosyltransferase [Kofleriaceae bacterium]|nr:glycosyltransferase [Kofleriaceae bacterium]
MVIVHVISTFGVGGQERMVRDLATGQAARGHRVIVVSLAPPPEGPLAVALQAGGVEPLTVAKGPGVLDPTLGARLAWAFKRRDADVVHTHNPLAMAYGAAAGRAIGATVVHTQHGLHAGSRGQRLVRRQLARLVDAFVAVSPAIAHQLRTTHELGDRIDVIENGLRLDRFRPDPEQRAAVRAELGLPADAFVIGNVGRIDEWKNQRLLLAAAAPLLGDKVRVVFVGDGPAEAELALAIARLPNPAWARMVARRDDLDRVLTAFDCFALTSRSDALPMVVLEAMATGLPVVATAVGALPGVIADGETGYLTAVDEAEVRDRLRRLVSGPEATRAMGGRARADALARHDAARMVDDYLRLYERTADARGRRR